MTKILSSDLKTKNLGHPGPVKVPDPVPGPAGDGDAGDAGNGGSGDIIVSDEIQNVVNESLSKYSERDIWKMVFQLNLHAIRLKSNQIIKITVLICFWLLIVTNSLLLCIWAWLYDQISSNLTKTFAWELLQGSFGSLFDWVNVCTIALKNHRIQDCSKPKIKYGRPFIPIFSIVLLGIFNFLALCFLFCKHNCSRKFLLITMKRFIYVQTIFVLIGIPVTSILLAQDLTEMKTTMRSEMKNWQFNGNRWNLSQARLTCCGVDSALEWVDEIGNVPPSCCNNSLPGCPEIRTSSNVWRNGCFEPESQIVNFFTMVEISSLIFGFILALALLYTSKSYVDCIDYDEQVSAARGRGDDDGERYFNRQRQRRPKVKVQVVVPV